MFKKLKRYLIKKWTGLTDYEIKDLQTKVKLLYREIPKYNNLTLHYSEKISHYDLCKKNDIGEYCSFMQNSVRSKLLKDVSNHIRIVTENDPVDLTYTVYGMIEIVNND